MWENKSRKWSEIFFDLWDIFTERFSQAAKRKRTKIFRIFSATILLTIGGIFFLSGLARWLGKILGESDWAGYMLVGIILVVISAFVIKNNGN